MENTVRGKRHYVNHCWHCKTHLDSELNETCLDCGWLICPICGSCEPSCDYYNGGYNVAGFDRDGYNRAGYDAHGYDREGYNRSGYSSHGAPRKKLDFNGFDADGYDHDGYDRYGFDRNGYKRDGFDKNGYSANGYDRNGNDRNGNNKYLGKMIIYPKLDGEFEIVACRCIKGKIYVDIEGDDGKVLQNLDIENALQKKIVFLIHEQ